MTVRQLEEIAAQCAAYRWYKEQENIIEEEM